MRDEETRGRGDGRFFLERKNQRTLKQNRTLFDFQTVEKVKIRHHRRTCADDGDTDREILREIVCEERSDECAISRKILSRGIPKGGTGRSGEAVPDGSPFCSVSGNPTRCIEPCSIL